MKRLLGATAALALLAGAAQAEVVVSTDPQAVAAQLQALGYTRIEIDVGPTQTKVEAVRDGVKLEYVFDSNLNVLKQETEPAEAEDLVGGVEIDFEDENFVDAAGEDRDDDDDEDDDDEDDDEEEDDDHDDEDDDHDDENDHAEDDEDDDDEDDEDEDDEEEDEDEDDDEDDDSDGDDD